jgi:hypothetical protein
MGMAKMRVQRRIKEKEARVCVPSCVNMNEGSYLPSTTMSRRYGKYWKVRKALASAVFL